MIKRQPFSERKNIINYSVLGLLSVTRYSAYSVLLGTRFTRCYSVLLGTRLTRCYSAYSVLLGVTRLTRCYSVLLGTWLTRCYSVLLGVTRCYSVLGLLGVKTVNGLLGVVGASIRTLLQYWRLSSILIPGILTLQYLCFYFW